MGDFSVTSNAPEIIAEIAAGAAGLTGAVDVLKKEVAQDIITTLPSFMSWQNGTGALASSFSFDGTAVFSDLPYAHRREFSFHGPDSMGRMFPTDPAAFYMRDTLQQVTSGGVIDEAFTTVMNGLFPGGA